MSFVLDDDMILEFDADSSYVEYLEEDDRRGSCGSNCSNHCDGSCYGTCTFTCHNRSR